MLIRSEVERKINKLEQNMNTVSAISSSLAFMPKVGPFLSLGAELIFNKENRKQLKEERANLAHLDNMDKNHSNRMYTNSSILG